ncbi:MAG: thioredoxin family protein [Candidatus Thorarchaeota archaeon]|nr:thioredoxin family protein [Candidatus Thorarchaeota archaeon]
MVVEMEEATKEQVRIMFATLDHEVTAHLFVKDHDCLYCGDTTALITQVADLSEKVKVEIHKGEIGAGKAAEFEVTKHPTIVLHGKENYKVRFLGIPAGHEFGALVAGIVAVSTGAVPLQPDVIDDIKAIDKPLHIQVFSTPQCPYCPNMVRLAHYAAILNPLIKGDMVEALEFQDMATKYQVFGVPKTIINETVHLEGAVTPEVFVEKLYDAVEK